MRYEAVSYRKEDHVMIINMPKIAPYPAGIMQLADELADLCAALGVDQEIRVAVINWELEKAPEGMELGGDITGIDEIQTSFYSLTAPVANLDLPVIAAINGYAIGQALELALACDIRIASKTSYFGLPHINAGLIPGDGGTQRLSRLIGKDKAIEMILTGEMINAQEAQRIGLVNRTLADKDLMPVVTDMAHKIASKSPIASRYAREAIHKGLDLTLTQGLRLEADLYFLLHTTRDRAEGIRAFQEKRKAQFEGK
jgi:enoyl-CoA hydratase/carnithine racemase